MKNTQKIVKFDVVIDGEKGKWTPLIESFPELGKTQSIAGGDKQLTSLEEIQIRFDYPLREPVTFSYKNKGGFTLSTFWEAVYSGYLVIYYEEDETAPVKADQIDRGMVMNRPKTDGKYGVWGHDMGDLLLERIVEVSPGLFSLSIGS